jgi:hypothetical protein
VKLKRVLRTAMAKIELLDTILLTSESLEVTSFWISRLQLG